MEILKTKYKDMHLQETSGKVKDYIIKIVKFVIISGIAYVILQPWVVLILRSFMDRQDMYNADVFIIPRNFTFYNMAYVWELLELTKY